MTGLDRAQVDDLLAGHVGHDAMNKLAVFEQQFSNVKDPRATIDRFVNGPRKPLADIVPHWQRALDGKFKALTQLSAMLTASNTSEYFPQSVDLNDKAAVTAIAHLAKARATLRDLGFDEDAKMLRIAQAYSFNTDTCAAIREAARSIPHDAPLSSIETPNTGAGWFWFAEPLPILASPIAADVTHALLWGWVNASEHREAALVFSCYVIGDDAQTKHEHLEGVPIPSTRWYWPLSMSFHDMLAFNAASHDESYGPGSPMEHDPNIIGKEKTLYCVSELSLFFVMACLWFKQTVPVLTQSPGHVERHARKRIAREHKLVEPPTVQVVALRKSQRVPAEDAPAERRDGAREYHCRWIVKGHPRLQACGPQRKDRKLIWIEAHPAGPDDKPLRTREKVFAVVR